MMRIKMETLKILIFFLCIAMFLIGFNLSTIIHIDKIINCSQVEVDK